MSISEHDLRQLVRGVIARRQGGDNLATAQPGPGATIVFEPRHVSHLKFAIPRAGEAEGACVIDPDVRCTHCGYCQSLGH